MNILQLVFPFLAIILNWFLSPIPETCSINNSYGSVFKYNLNLTTFPTCTATRLIQATTISFLTSFSPSVVAYLQSIFYTASRVIILNNKTDHSTDF